MRLFKISMTVGLILLPIMVFAHEPADVAENSLILPVTWLVHFLEGTGGLFAAMCGLVVGIYGAFVSHSLWQLACSMVFEMVLHYMPSVL